MLGPWAGAAVGAVGSSLADVLLGWAAWAPWTFLIKGLVGLIIGTLSNGRSWGRNLLAMSVAAVFTIAAYGFVSLKIFGEGYALVEIYGNVFQTGVGMVLAFVLVSALRRALSGGKLR